MRNEGERTLTASELATVVTALGAITRSSAMSCGADASELFLDVQTAYSLDLYADDFYSGCPSGDLLGRTFRCRVGRVVLRRVFARAVNDSR